MGTSRTLKLAELNGVRLALVADAESPHPLHPGPGPVSPGAAQAPHSPPPAASPGLEQLLYGPDPTGLSSPAAGSGATGAAAAELQRQLEAEGLAGAGGAASAAVRVGAALRLRAGTRVQSVACGFKAWAP